MNNKVSVLICTYNCEKYITNTLNSVLDQTYKDFNILICENDSKDKTREILKEFESKYSDIIKVYYQSANLGAYGGLNYLLDKTNSKYIAIQDHDDLWHPDKLEAQVNFLDNNKEYIGCGTNIIYYYEQNNSYRLGTLHKRDTWVYHTSLIFKNSPKKYNLQITFETDLYFIKFILCKNNKKIFNLNKYYIIHRIRKDNNNLGNTWIKKHSIITIFSQAKKMDKLNLRYIIYTIGYKYFKKLYLILFKIKNRSKFKNIKKLKKNKELKVYYKYLN